jgi:predicted  nucleic acid-binding Zn-ribbon protein
MSDDILVQILARLTAIEAGQTELRAAMMARMDRLQTRIDQLGDEWFVAYAQHEGLGRRIDNARSETTDIRDQISGLMRQVRALRDRLDGLEGP